MPAADNTLGDAFRLFFGSAMAAAVVLGFVTVRRRDFRAHRAWMIRGYAIAMGAGTQVFTHLPWVLLVGAPTGNTRALLMLAGWVINLAVAEWAIRHRPRHAVRDATAAAGRISPRKAQRAMAGGVGAAGAVAAEVGAAGVGAAG